jgi:RNA polymerase sigma factor (sigma-70 family)
MPRKSPVQKPRVEAPDRGDAGAVAAQASDAQMAAWIARMANGDAQGLKSLHEATLGRVYGLALRIVRTRESAEEVAVDVYLQAWRKAHTYDTLRGAPLAWLLTLCRSRALDHLRRAEPSEAHADPDSLARPESLDHHEDPQDLLAAVESHTQLKRALEDLSALQRQLIALAFFRGLTHQEIAAHARLPLGSVKTYIRRALTELRARLATVH